MTASPAATPSAPRIALRQVGVMPATSTSVNASTNSTAEARKAAITIAHCIGVFLLLKTRPDREQRRAIPRRSHHEGRVFWWSWNHLDRKSTRLNSSHSQISYAVFCLKKKN